jgi:Flp pilus assembly protein TadD
MNKAIELDPLNGYAWANVGLFLAENRDYAAARSAIRRAAQEARIVPLKGRDQYAIITPSYSALTQTASANWASWAIVRVCVGVIEICP